MYPGRVKLTALPIKKALNFYEFSASMPIAGRKNPIKLVVEGSLDDQETVNEIFDTFSYIGVQNELFKEAGIGKNYLDRFDEIRVSKELKEDDLIVDVQKKIIALSFLKAPYRRGGELAWVLSGGSDKGFAYPWFFETLMDMGLVPAYIYAVSTAAYFGGRFSLDGDAEKEIAETKGVITDYSWQECVDLHIKGLLADPDHYSGFIMGQYLMNMNKTRFGMKDKFFSDMKIPLFTVSVRVPSKHKPAKAVIFCDPKYRDQMSDGPEEVVEYDYKVTVAARASGGIPVAFKRFNINNEEVKTVKGEIKRSIELPDEYHVDGGLFENLPLKAALRNKNIGRIVAVHLGYTGELDDQKKNSVKSVSNDDFVNFAEAGMFTIDYLGVSQMDILSSDKTKGAQILVYNPHFFDLESMGGLTKGQLIGLSMAKGFKKIIRRKLDGKTFSMSKLPADMPPEFKRKLAADYADKVFAPLTKDDRRSVEAVAKIRDDKKWPNVMYFEEKDPMYNKDPESALVKSAVEKDGGPVIPAQAKKKNLKWIFDTMANQLNPIRTVILAGWAIATKGLIKLLFLKLWTDTADFFKSFKH